MLNVKESPSLTFRIGRVELSILKAIKKHEYNDTYRKSLKRHTDHNIREFVDYLIKSDQWTLKRRNEFINDLKAQEVSFTRALYKLIEKGLVYRGWTIRYKQTCGKDFVYFDEVGKLSDGISHCHIWGGPDDRELDIEKFKILSVEPHFNLTKLGESELTKRLGRAV